MTARLDAVYRLARSAGFWFNDDGRLRIGNLNAEENEIVQRHLISFAAFLIGEEREACAMVCENRHAGSNTPEDEEAKKCAIAIRNMR